MTAKPMVRFYAVIFNKIGALFNEIYIDIRSKSETHKLIKDWIHKHRPGVGFLRHNFLHFPTAFGRAGPLLLPKGRVGLIVYILVYIALFFGVIIAINYIEGNGIRSAIN